MYLRRSERKNKDGSKVEYIGLAVNEWDSERKRSIAKTIHSFGRFTEANSKEVIGLAKSIAKAFNIELVIPEGIKDSEPYIKDPLPAKVTQHITKAFGAVLTLEHIWEKIGLGELLRGIVKEAQCEIPYERALLAMTLNRLCDPESKLGVWDRWLKKVYLPSCDELKLDHMYEAMDILVENAEEVERHVFFKTAHLFNLNVDIIFYDTTTASFSIDPPYEEDEDDIRMFGHNKEGTWAYQAVVALAVTKEGIPVRSWVFPGNTQDVTTVERVKKDLKGWNLGRCLFVADAGINSANNREKLAQSCGRYMLATRVGSVKEIKEEVLSRPGRFRKIADNLHAKEVIVGKGVRHRRYILCYNPKEAKRQSKHREYLLGELISMLASHKDHKATQKWAIELLASKRYGRYLKVDSNDCISIDSEKIKKAQKLDGKWVLITNDDTITVEDAASGYKGLMIIERCFRTLKKSQIMMTPMNHRLPTRIEAHVKICVLSLLLQRLIEISCDAPWKKVFEKLDRLQATEYRTSNHAFLRRNEVDPETKEILKKLEISIPKHILSIEKMPSTS